jgi:hypothetical protein
LDKYKYAGHSVILGRKKRQWQHEADVLALFSGGKNEARRRYRRFVEEGMERRYALSAKGIGLDGLLHAVAEHMEILPEDILRPGKARDRVFARSLLCFWATRELGKTMTELAVQIGMTVAAVSISVSRGEKIVKEVRSERYYESLNFKGILLYTLDIVSLCDIMIV